ncbi:MerC domain-containing protein [Mucisphaera sp.]|uniref:MerC domain-containing protein n=1 Tax=Mucisphaera sp. TaxID=2913024 RepID=UPI003D14A7BB
MTTAPIGTIPNNPDLPAAAPQLPRSANLDRLGIVASAACAIHCLAAPFLFMLLPAVGSVWSHPSVHWILAALVLPLALFVVLRGYRLHRRRSAPIALVLGVTLILAGLALPSLAAGSPPPTGEPLAMAANGEESGLAASACTESCCPTVTQDAETGTIAVDVPPASIVTLIGSLFLVLAHAINLHGCYCFNRTPEAQATQCGCPTGCGND